MTVFWSGMPHRVLCITALVWTWVKFYPYGQCFSGLLGAQDCFHRCLSRCMALYRFVADSYICMHQVSTSTRNVLNWPQVIFMCTSRYHMPVFRILPISAILGMTTHCRPSSLPQWPFMLRGHITLQTNIDSVPQDFNCCPIFHEQFIRHVYLVHLRLLMTTYSLLSVGVHFGMVDTAIHCSSYTVSNAVIMSHW